MGYGLGVDGAPVALLEADEELLLVPHLLVLPQQLLVLSLIELSDMVVYIYNKNTIKYTIHRRSPQRNRRGFVFLRTKTVAIYLARIFCDFLSAVHELVLLELAEHLILEIGYAAVSRRP